MEERKEEAGKRLERGENVEREERVESGKLNSLSPRDCRPMSDILNRFVCLRLSGKSKVIESVVERKKGWARWGQVYICIG
jgi:hypothetical protein